MVRIAEARALAGYHLFLRFEDGATGEVNLAPHVGKGVFKAWADPAEFARVFVDPATGTVAWPGGVDLDPDQLYHDATGAPLPGSQAALK